MLIEKLYGHEHPPFLERTSTVNSVYLYRVAILSTMYRSLTKRIKYVLFLKKTAIPGRKRPQTHALDREATGIACAPFFSELLQSQLHKHR